MVDICLKCGALDPADPCGTCAMLALLNTHYCEDCEVEEVEGRYRFCESCRRKRNVTRVAAARRKEAARLSRHAVRLNRRWTPEEDELLTVTSASVADLAQRLGRSRWAIVNRRRRLQGEIT